MNETGIVDLETDGTNLTALNASVANSSTDYIPYDERPETYIVPVLFFIIFVVGVIGNGTLVVIFLRHRTMRNVPNTYILSLALADLLVIITSVPFTSTIYTVESWPWGVTICKISETAKDISIGVSVFTLTALSADRFFAIVDPLKKFHTSSGGKKATRITLCVAISIWLLSIICAVPAAVASYLRRFQDGDRYFDVCYPYPETWLNHRYAQVMVLAKFFFLYLIPLVVIAMFYICMAAYLFMSTKNLPGEMQGGMQRQVRARKKVAITVLVFVLMFAVCFLPTNIFMLFFYFQPNFLETYNDFWHYLRIVGFCLGYLNSCANPVALYFVSGAFRKHFNRYLLCIKPKRSRCNTCQGQHTTQMSLVSTKRNQSICSRRGRNVSINRRPMDPLVTQETSVALLLNNGDEHMCSKI
ncbi:neuropeptide CCHamide-1 receptor [Aethina tumida]|uniref:neuropeptide CCHamide-1 receptor n=1 Tax=Aethina tumida TaxID=116153 RepID=UPI002148E47A|nr:neuropeptide CCHamide-1 receptor [Aethina tumida]